MHGNRTDMGMSFPTPWLWSPPPLPAAWETPERPGAFPDQMYVVVALFTMITKRPVLHCFRSWLLRAGDISITQLSIGVQFLTASDF